MRYASFFYRGVEDESVAVGKGIAQGLLEALPVPEEAHLPDRLKELAALLIERDALGQAEEPGAIRPGEPTRLASMVEDDPPEKPATN